MEPLVCIVYPGESRKVQVVFRDQTTALPEKIRVEIEKKLLELLYGVLFGAEETRCAATISICFKHLVKERQIKFQALKIFVDSVWLCPSSVGDNHADVKHLLSDLGDSVTFSSILANSRSSLWISSAKMMGVF